MSSIGLTAKVLLDRRFATVGVHVLERNTPKVLPKLAQSRRHFELELLVEDLDTDDEHEASLNVKVGEEVEQVLSYN